MYRTPRFYSFIDEVAYVLDLFEDLKRKRLLSESRTFDQKQVYFSDFLDRLKSKLDLDDNEIAYISNVIFKLENVLSDLSNTPIYSTTSFNIGKKLFFNLFTIPFISFLLNYLVDKNRNAYFTYLSKFITLDSISVLKPNHVISKTKEIIKLEIISDVEINESSKFISLFLSKLDDRSFPKIKTIKKFTDELYHDASNWLGEKESSNLSSSIYQVLLAARTAFNISQFIIENKLEDSQVDYSIQAKFARFQECYFFQENIDKDNQCYLKDANYKQCKEHFLMLIGQQEPLFFLKRHGTRMLWQHDDGVFLSYCIREQLYSDINKGRISSEVIDKYPEIIRKLRDRQSGEDGIYIAMFVIALTIKHKSSIPNNFLSPMVSFLTECLKTDNIKTQICNTPFGFYLPCNLTSTELNLALAIRTFNHSIKEQKLITTYCNPLQPLDSILEIYFDKNGFSSKQLRIKPIKGFKESIYDALKKIDFHILNFELQEKACRDENGYVWIISSYAGKSINRFLKLDNEKRKTILEIVSPEEYKIDLEK